jgi:hypothetical protein
MFFLPGVRTGENVGEGSDPKRSRKQYAGPCLYPLGFNKMSDSRVSPIFFFFHTLTFSAVTHASVNLESDARLRSVSRLVEVPSSFTPASRLRQEKAKDLSKTGTLGQYLCRQSSRVRISSIPCSTAEFSSPFLLLH